MVAKLFWLFVGSIIYTYLIYPVLLTLLAQTRPKPQLYRSVTTPSVTLLIAAYNEQAVIAEKLENSLALDYPRDQLQILVAADGSDDRTADIVREYADRGVELSYTPLRQGKMAAIIQAMSRARGEIVLFSDANNMYPSDVIREFVAPFAIPEVGGVTGAKLILSGDGVLGESEGLYWKYESFIRSQETRLSSSVGTQGEAFAIRRSLFESPPESIINDDFYMATRLLQRGYRVVYNPKARSVERISLSAQDERIRRTRIIAGRYQAMALAHKLLPMHHPVLIWQIVSHKFLRPLVPLAMVGALITNVIAVMWPTHTTNSSLFHLAWPFNWIILSLQMAFYSLAWIGNYIEHNSSIGKLLYLPTFLVNSNGAAIIGLYRFLTKRQTTLWQRVPRPESPQINVETK